MLNYSACRCPITIGAIVERMLEHEDVVRVIAYCIVYCMYVGRNQAEVV